MIVGALAHCDDGVDLLVSPVAMTVVDNAKEKDLTALPVKQPCAPFVKTDIGSATLAVEGVNTQPGGHFGT
jgi:hypothetical protein